MILEYIKIAWNAYKENLMSFIFASLILWTIPSIIVFIGMGIIFGSVGISTFTEIYNQKIMLSRIVYYIPLIINMGVASILFIIASLVFLFLLIGMYGMAAQSLRGKTKVWTIFKFSKQKGLTGIIVSIIVGIISFFLFLFLIMVLDYILPFFSSYIASTIFVLIIVFFSLIFPGIIVDNLNVFESIKMSFSITKKNYLQTFGLNLFYGIIFLVLMIIPVVRIIGSLIIIFILMPMFLISLVQFYKRNKI